MTRCHCRLGLTATLVRADDRIFDLNHMVRESEYGQEPPRTILLQWDLLCSMMDMFLQLTGSVVAELYRVVCRSDQSCTRQTGLI